MFRKPAVSDRWAHSLLCVLITYARHLLVGALLSGWAGKASADVKSQKITAFMGKTAILPCSIPTSPDLPTVEWSKDGLSPSIIFLYRHGCETFDAKNQDFWYRTSLDISELQNGNLSLRISNLQLSDKGTYWCKILQGDEPEAIALLDLVVVAVSELKLAVLSYAAGALTVQCEVECWFPKPEITFLDEQGNEILAEEQRRCQNSGECFCITRRAILQTATDRVTCRVQVQHFNLIRNTGISISDDLMRPDTTSIAVSVVVTLIVTLGVCGVAFFVYKKTKCNGRRQTSSLSGYSNHADSKKENEIQKPAAGPRDFASTRRDSKSSDDQPDQNNSKPAAVSASHQSNSLDTQEPKQAASGQSPSSGPHFSSVTTSEGTNNACTIKSKPRRNSNRPLSSLSIKAVSPEESKPLIN